MTLGPQQLLAPFEALSFRQSVAIGACGGLLMLGLGWAVGPAMADPPAQSASAVAGSAAHDGSEPGGDGDGGDEPAMRSGADGRDVAAASNGGPSEQTAATDGSEPGGERSDMGANGGPSDGGSATSGADGGPLDGGSATRGADGGTLDGGSATSGVDGGPLDGGSATRGADGEDSDDGAESDGPSPSSDRRSGASPSPTARDADADAERSMTAEELRIAAQQALDERRYRDAYRLATRSQYKRRSNATLLIKGLAACGMKDSDAAKDVVRALPQRDDRRKAIRKSCRDRGARIGL